MSDRSALPRELNYRKGRFFNPHVKESSKNLGDLLKFQKELRLNPWPDWIDDVVPRSIDSFSPPKISPFGRLTMINHASILLEWERCNILTDPVFGQRVSPFSFAGPRRSRRAGMELKDLPAIDGVIISHNHYDHMDIPSLKSIHAANPACVFMVPLGNSKILRHHGIRNVVEFDWYDSYQLNNDFKIHAVPAQHWSGRGLFDHHKTLWCGFVIESKAQQILFAGDSGYGSHFHEISERFTKIDLSLLPIGAYEPRSFLKVNHMNPEEAVKAHLDLKSKRSLAIHYGTFQLSKEGPEEPLQKLFAAKKYLGVADDDFLAIANGTTIEMT